MRPEIDFSKVNALYPDDDQIEARSIARAEHFLHVTQRCTHAGARRLSQVENTDLRCRWCQIGVEPVLSVDEWMTRPSWIGPLIDHDERRWSPLRETGSEARSREADFYRRAVLRDLIDVGEDSIPAVREVVLAMLTDALAIPHVSFWLTIANCENWRAAYDLVRDFHLNDLARGGAR